MPKTMRCPICYTRLVPGKGMKMECPTEGCDFIDRRNGNTVVDPSKDRRGKEIQFMMPNKNDPWRHADRKPIR